MIRLAAAGSGGVDILATKVHRLRLHLGAVKADLPLRGVDWGGLSAAGSFSGLGTWIPDWGKTGPSPIVHRHSCRERVGEGITYYAYQNSCKNSL